MNEYFECMNCGQVVQGWNASQMIECCRFPRYRRIERDDTNTHAFDIPPIDDSDAAPFMEAAMGYTIV